MTPDAIRTTRERLGLTVRSFAETLGVAPRTVRRWEDGSRVVSPMTALFIQSIVEKQ